MLNRHYHTTTVRIELEQEMRLKELNEKTKVPVAELVRQGIDLVLERHAPELPWYQLSLFPEAAR